MLSRVSKALTFKHEMEQKCHDIDNLVQSLQQLKSSLSSRIASEESMKADLYKRQGDLLAELDRKAKEYEENTTKIQKELEESKTCYTELEHELQGLSNNLREITDNRDALQTELVSSKDQTKSILVESGIFFGTV